MAKGVPWALRAPGALAPGDRDPPARRSGPRPDADGRGEENARAAVMAPGWICGARVVLVVLVVLGGVGWCWVVLVVLVVLLVSVVLVMLVLVVFAVLGGVGGAKRASHGNSQLAATKLGFRPKPAGHEFAQLQPQHGKSVLRADLLIHCVPVTCNRANWPPVHRRHILRSQPALAQPVWLLVSLQLTMVNDLRRIQQVASIHHHVAATFHCVSSF